MNAHDIAAARRLIKQFTDGTGRHLSNHDVPRTVLREPEDVRRCVFRDNHSECDIGDHVWSLDVPDHLDVVAIIYPVDAPFFNHKPAPTELSHYRTKTFRLAPVTDWNGEPPKLSWKRIA